MQADNHSRRDNISLTLVMNSVGPLDAIGLRYWDSIVEALEEVGIEVRVLNVRAWRLLRPWDPDYGGRYQRNPVAVSPRLAWQVFSSRPDAVLALEYGMPTVWAILGGRLARAKLLIFQENRHPATLPISSRRRKYRRLVASSADWIIANTSGAEQELVNELKIPTDKIARITLLSPPDVDAMTKREFEFEDASSRPIFLFVGQLIERKNVETLLQSARILKERELSFSVWIVGDGLLRSHLVDVTRTLDVDDLVRFSNSISYEQIGHVYRHCDVFVMPSLVDYRSVAVLEAMRFGKPVIVSQSEGNVGEAVRPGVNGYVFDPRRSDELADCMAAFITDNSLIHEMGRQSKSLVDEQTSALAAGQLRRLIESRLTDAAN